MRKRCLDASRSSRLYEFAMWCAALLMLGGCNPFINHYSGEHYPPVKSVQVVMKPPSPDDVKWIGRCDFTIERKVGDAQAIAAAKKVGADIVEWSDSDAGNKLEWTSAPVAWNAWKGEVGMIPLPVIKKEIRYQARFYRSDSLGGAPIKNAKDQPMPEKVPPVEDDRPTTQEKTKSTKQPGQNDGAPAG